MLFSADSLMKQSMCQLDSVHAFSAS